MYYIISCKTGVITLHFPLHFAFSTTMKREGIRIVCNALFIYLFTFARYLPTTWSESAPSVYFYLFIYLFIFFF